MSKLRVAVLMGGTSSERAISLSTGRQIMAALDPAKYLPIALDVAALSPAPCDSLPATATPCGDPPDASCPNNPAPTDLIPLNVADLAENRRGGRPDVVIIALHGKGGEDGTVQGMLDLLGIPYTGSGVLASALAMDKARTKKMLRGEGIRVPDDIVLSRRGRPSAGTVDTWIRAAFGYPVIVKPNEGGSTIGCTIVRGGDGLDAAIEAAFAHDKTVLIEPLLSGVEITAGLLGNEDPIVLPLIEIVARGGFYDYEAKYAPGGSEHIIPARISEAAAARARDYAVRSHTALGCRGMSRVDMIVVGDQPYVLEINTIPGMTPTSLLPDAARAAGIDFPALLDRLIACALEKED